MTELERFRIRLFRANHALREQPAIKRWLQECFTSVWTGQQGEKRDAWLSHADRWHCTQAIAVIFIRDDGWSIAAREPHVKGAEQTWSQKWLYVAEAPRFNAIPYQAWESRRVLPADWTARSNFHDFTLTHRASCRGCKTDLMSGRAVLRAKYHGRGGTERFLFVCDDDCWATWNDKYWQSKAAYREQERESGRTAYHREKARRGYPLRGGGRTLT